MKTTNDLMNELKNEVSDERALSEYLKKTQNHYSHEPSSFAEYFKKSRKEYFLLLVKGVLDLFAMGIPTVLAVSFVQTGSYILNFGIKAVICLVIPNGVFILKNHRKPEFDAVKTRLKKLIR